MDVSKYGLEPIHKSLVVDLESFVENTGVSLEDTLAKKKISEIEIKKFEGVLPLNITVSYISKRKLDDMRALRELIQNALDESEEKTGEPYVDIRIDEEGVWVIDNGSGIKAKAFLVGASTKDCWMRGYYGEGLKLAVGYFVMKGYEVYLFSNGLVFKPFAFPPNAEDPQIMVLLGESNYSQGGTAILIKGLKVDEKVINQIVSYRNPDLKGKIIDTVPLYDEKCGVEKPYVIYDHPNLLYIRNLLVGKLSEVAKRPSFFSYDVWWFRLDVSRELLSYSMPKLFVQIAKVYEKSEKAKEKLAEKLVESEMVRVKKRGRGIMIVFDPIFGIFEGHLFVYSFPKGMLEKMLKALNLGDKEKCVRLFTEKDPEEKIDEAIENGIIPFLISSEIADLSKIPRYKEGEKCN